MNSEKEFCISVSVFRDNEIGSTDLMEVVVRGTYENTNVSLENFKVLDEAGTKCIQMCVSGPLLNLSLLALRKPKLCLFSSPFSLPLFRMRSLCSQLVHRLKDKGK